jgi:hypothetical protein
MAGREPAVAHESQPATPQVVQPPLMAYATPCVDAYHRDLDGCMEVTFRGDAVYQIDAPVGKCLVWDPGSAINDESAGDTHILSLKVEHRVGPMMVRIFYVLKGNRYKSFKCA